MTETPPDRPAPIGTSGPADAAVSLRLHRWSDRAVVAVAVIALASGFGQFGVVAALGDVSTQLGHVAAGSSIADKVGLSGTSLGIGLAVIRLASLGSLPLIGIADRLGRRRVILVVTMAGLALTVVAAASPGYWWFVVIFAFGRPLLSATNALAEVMAAEETSSHDRAAAVALIAAGYGVGAGLSAIVHSLASGALGFRGIFALAVVPLVVVYLMRGRVEEPNRFMVAEVATEHPTPILGAVGPRYRSRVVVLALIAFALSVITGPANSFVFLFAQDVLHQAGYVTALMVVAAGVTGLLGLLAGRWLADHVGRRPTCSVAMVAVAFSGALCYSGSRPALLVGYTVGVFCGSILAPGIGALLTELFPTSVRASVAGWWTTAGVLGAVGGLVAFGAVADVGNRFGEAASLVFLPAALASALFWLLPETRGREPESLWPEGA
ncbi:MAG TPA: MFS transporter [Acidimicrobiales bacterium]|nr:MFS transporter [Acidimicrobiales bacterium]